MDHKNATALPLAIPPARVVRGISADGLQVVTWACPRCEVRHIEDHEVDEDAVRCCACGADFVSDDEPERRWTLRQLPREQIGTREVFATRSCCGPGGVGPCISAAEGLPCGVALMPLFAPVPDGVRERGQDLRALRLGLGLSLGDAADGLGLRVSKLSMLESGRLDADDWDALRADLRALREGPTDA